MRGNTLQANSFVRGLYYWFKAIVRPGESIDEFKSDPDKVVISFWINLLFAFLYSLTALMGYLAGQEIMLEPWIPVAEKSYYLYQTFWTIPWGLATWVMLAGICHLLALAGKGKGYRYAYEDALLVVAIGWVLPWFVCGWLPETFFFMPLKVLPGALVEIVRLGVLPVIWQTMLIATGLRKTHEISWTKGIVIGFITNGVVFVMFVVFLR